MPLLRLENKGGEDVKRLGMEKTRKSVIGLLRVLLILITYAWAKRPAYYPVSAQSAPQYSGHNDIYNEFAGPNDSQIPINNSKRISPFTDVALKQESLAPT